MNGTRFDAYTATSRAIAHADAVDLVAATLRGHVRKLGHGYHHFAHRMAFTAPDGTQSAAVLWGGDAHRDLVMVEAKGETTPVVVAALREHVPHRCTRADSCRDFEEPGAFDRICRAALSIKRQHRLKGEKRGDWDYPEDGRTLYLGSPSSSVRVRCYEKGKEPDLRHLGRFDLVRVEAQVRPVRDAREAYARLNADEVWGASAFTRELAARVLGMQVRPAPAGWCSRGSSRDQALRWMCWQYGPHLVSLKDDLGDWKAVGLTLAEMISESRQRRS